MKLLTYVLVMCALVVGVAAQAQQNCYYVDFGRQANLDLAPAGLMVTNQFANVEISTVNNNGPNQAILFDSTNPTGNDDDLGAPNEDFGGPGVGDGGEIGEPGQNAVILGNVLIIAKDLNDVSPADGLVDDPNDDNQGGEITFEFSVPVTITRVDVLDIDTVEGLTVSTYNEIGTQLGSYPASSLGDNSHEVLSPNDAQVKTMKATFTGSGALGGYEYCVPGDEVPEFGSVAAATMLALMGLFIYKKRH